MSSTKVALVQAASVLFDLEASVERVSHFRRTA